MLAESPRVTEQFNTFLESGSDQELPKRFTFDTLKFFSGSTELMQGSENTIDEIVIALKTHPAAVVRLESFTDNIGNPIANLKLSRARARSVKQILIGRGIDSARIKSVGRGASHPVASNGTPEGRRLNRRIEMVVLQK